MAKSLQKLNLNSAFLFAAALADPETCKLVLEILLGRKIPKVNVKSENTLLFNPEAKCVRLDIHATDDMEVHSILLGRGYVSIHLKECVRKMARVWVMSQKSLSSIRKEKMKPVFLKK